MSALRFRLNSADPEQLAGFYCDALGFRWVGRERVSAAAYGVDGEATLVRLVLGEQEIVLVGFDRPGQPYPPGSTSHDAWFQHLALVATDIDRAYARLRATAGWSPISRGGGPVQLPERSGGVRAFKFRDPEGHPLELLQFPPGKAPPVWADRMAEPGPLIGIDHSAIVVADVAASIAVYERHGFGVTASTENVGPEQDALDGATDVAVSVRALSRGDAAPHLELLGYHRPPVRAGRWNSPDLACTATVLNENGHPDRDPDGHMILA